MRRKPRRSELTGERLLEAGRRIVLEHGMSTTLPVRVSDVVASLGLTTGAAYQVWPTQEKFQRALADHLLESTLWAEPVLALTQLKQHLDTVTITFAASIREICAALIGCLVGQPEYYVQLHFAAVAYHETELREVMRRGYERFHTEFVSLYDSLLDRYGISLVPPHTVDDLATTITAIAEGFAIRALVDARRAGAPLRLGVGSESQWDLYLRAVSLIVVGFAAESSTEASEHA